MREFWRRERADGTLAPTLWTNLHGRRVSTGCKDRRAAIKWKRAREREGADPRHAAAERASLGDAIRELYAELRRRGRSKATQDRAKKKLGHFARLWGVQRKLSTIDARLIGQYIDTRLTDRGIRKGSKVERITVRDELAFLRQALKLARRQGCYAHAIDDVMPIRFETGHKPRKDFIPFVDLPRLLTHVASNRIAHVLFFCVTGGRIADSYRARRSDFDTIKWRIHIRGSKTEGSLRTIPVPNFLRPLVRLLLAEDTGGGPDLLFREWVNINRDIKATCVRAKVPKVSTNGLRRTFGHALRMHGFDLDAVSKLFGHTTTKLVRDVYANVDGDELATLVEMQEAASMTYKKRTGTPQKAAKAR